MRVRSVYLATPLVNPLMAQPQTVKLSLQLTLFNILVSTEIDVLMYWIETHLFPILPSPNTVCWRGARRTLQHRQGPSSSSLWPVAKEMVSGKKKLYYTYNICSIESLMRKKNTDARGSFRVWRNVPYLLPLAWNRTCIWKLAKCWDLSKDSD